MKRNGFQPVPKLTDEQKTSHWSHIQVAGDDECWPWANKSGKLVSYRPMWCGVNAARVIYAIYYGIEPDKFEVCHTCDNKTCCNPAHLWLGTHQQNMMDVINKGYRKKYDYTPRKQERERRKQEYKLQRQQKKDAVAKWIRERKDRVINAFAK